MTNHETITAIIADDEAELRSDIQRKLTKVWPQLDILGMAANGPEAIRLIETEAPDIAFLDIRMPGLSGLEVAAQTMGKANVVFITAFDQYAIDAFDNEAIDYILKPVKLQRLEKTVARLKKRFAEKSETTTDITAVLRRLQKTIEEKKTSPHLQWIRAQHGDHIRLIPVEEISLFKSADKYTMVISKSGESLIRKTIKELEAQLDPDKFWRIHRGTIINAGFVTKVSRSLTGRYAVKVKDYDEPLMVSRAYTHLFRQM